MRVCLVVRVSVLVCLLFALQAFGTPGNIFRLPKEYRDIGNGPGTEVQKYILGFEKKHRRAVEKAFRMKKPIKRPDFPTLGGEELSNFALLLNVGLIDPYTGLNLHVPRTHAYNREAYDSEFRQYVDWYAKTFPPDKKEARSNAKWGWDEKLLSASIDFVNQVKTFGNRILICLDFSVSFAGLPSLHVAFLNALIEIFMLVECAFVQAALQKERKGEERLMMSDEVLLRVHEHDFD